MNEHPIIEETVRPWRLWHAQGKKYLPWRYYKYHENARINGWIEAKRQKIGHSIEVIDARNGKCIGVYTRRVNSVTFDKEKSNVID